jgi:hypothetical protein
MSSLPNESWSFSLDDYAIQHQGIHVIDLNISYDYRAGLGATIPYEYPNFLPVAAFINDFLVNYSVLPSFYGLWCGVRKESGRAGTL